MDTANDARPSTGPWWVKLVGWIGLTLHLSLFFWYAASGLLAPGWAIAVLMAFWLGLLMLAFRLYRRRPLLVPIVPLVALVVWLLAISAGEAWLGWTG